MKKRMITKCFRIILVMLIVLQTTVYAKKNEELPTESTPEILLFTSDLHNKTKEKLEPFLTRYKETVEDTSYICFGGDYAKKFDPKVLEQVVQTVSKSLPNTKAIYTIGNHERIDWKEPDFKKITGQEATNQLVKGDGYLLYTIGAAGKEQEFTKEELTKLKKVLEESRTIIPRVPIFIISHFPIHYCEGEEKIRESKMADELITLLHQYSNVIFLYGHNHTLKDQNYSQVIMPGDSIEIHKQEERVINFAYASLGCMKDGASQHIYALKATLVKTPCCNKVTLEHLNEYAEPMDKLMICYPLAE